MHGIAANIDIRYRAPMVETRRRGPKIRMPAEQPAAKRFAPNRIAELTKQNSTSYPEIAEALHTSRGTIAKLANSTQEMTRSWQEALAGHFNVSPEEIFTPPKENRLRRIPVKGRLAAGAWQEGFTFDPEDQYDVLIPQDERLQLISLYAAEVGGSSMNMRYPAGSVIVLSYVGDGVNDVIPGRRYHVKRTRADGMVEDTIKTLVKGEDGKFWLKPESTDPEFQEWIALEGQPGMQIELIGRVRYAVQREE